MIKLEKVNFKYKNGKEQLNDTFIVISDTHLGNIFENIDYIYMVYEFAKKNNITHIYHCGDLLDKTIENMKTEYKDITKLFEHLLKDYPSYSNITTNILLGNHDYYYKENLEILLNSRDDFSILGIRKAYINYLNSIITFNHKIDKCDVNILNIFGFINFYGHTHNYCIKENSIYLPPLCDNTINNSLPGFLVVSSEECTINIRLYTIENQKIIDNDKVFSKKIFTSKTNMI